MLRVLVGVSLLLTLVTPVVVEAAPTGNVEVVHLGVDGRTHSPVGLGNPHPTLSWQLIETRQAQSHPCHRPSAWRVRVWDADSQPSRWSDPVTWSMGCSSRTTGAASWIDYPDRAAHQPLPIFARQFTIPRGKRVTDARLYLSGVGLHHATVNGKELTDEVLAPGNSNYQLSSEYRTYDLTGTVRTGGNTIGVELGNGTAYVRRSVTNPAVGRTSPYSWWQSQLKGDSTLAADVAAGATTVTLDTVAGYHVGGTINIDTGGGGDRLESREITAIDPTTGSP